MENNIPKFRAFWNGEMRDVLVIDWLNNLVDLSGGLIEIPLHDLELMQYIGMSDDGEEMYEQDIVDHTYLIYAGYGDVQEESQRVVLESITSLPFIGLGGDVSCHIVGNTIEGTGEVK